MLLTAMAKDSNKRAVLNRRKLELDHAITNEFSASAIVRRAEKLRAAALAVAKKYCGDFAHLEGCPGNRDWIELKTQWEQFTIDEVIEIASHWPEKPTVRHVRLER